MKRLRMKAVGLGLALVAGSTVVADDNPRPRGQDRPAKVATTAGPGLSPPAVRGMPPPVTGEPIWLPARQAPTVVVPAGGQQEPYPPPRPQPTGPRIPGGDLGTLPPIPTAPGGLFEPMNPMPVERQPDTLPAPRPVDPMPMPVPKPPDFLAPLPTPRPVQPALPTAPPELMCPVGGTDVRKHATFGSLPIQSAFGSQPLRLSRDYPPIGDLIQHGHGQGQGHGEMVIDDGAGAGPMDRCFVRGEYLLWWLPGYAIPVLATTNANPTANAFLGEPGTTAIVGPGRLIDSTRHGFRIRAGAWVDECASCGIDAGFFFLGERSASAMFGTSRFPLITRPIFVPNMVPGSDQPIGENGQAVAVPGILSGTLAVRGESRLWGADVNLRKCLFRDCDVRAELFAGYRYLNLRESLTITEDITVIGPGGMRVGVPDPIGTRIIVQDQFTTRNSFHGGQLGLAYERRRGRWDMDARLSVALGATHQELEIEGFQVRQQPGAPRMNFRGGLLAAGPNLGEFSRDRFSVVPEFTLNVGYWVTPSVRVFAGYNFLYWSNVIRPGDQIDRVVDVTFVPNSPAVPPSGQNRPAPLFKQSDLVINGIQVGLEWRW